MPMIRVPKLGQYKGRAPIEPGVYDLEITQAEFAWSKDADKDIDPPYQLKVTYTVVDGPTQTNGGDPVGRKVFGNHWLPREDDGEESRAGVVLQNLLTSSDIEVSEDGEFDIVDLVGKAVRGRVAFSTSKNKETGAYEPSVDIDGHKRTEVTNFVVSKD